MSRDGFIKKAGSCIRDSFACDYMRTLNLAFNLVFLRRRLRKCELIKPAFFPAGLIKLFIAYERRAEKNVSAEQIDF